MNVVSTYLKDIEKSLSTGKATEHTYRPALKELIESLLDDIEATNEPKREQCGAPDFIVTKANTPIGYKGCQLTYDDITHYQRIVAILAETIHLMTAIDETINSNGGWPIV